MSRASLVLVAFLSCAYGVGCDDDGLGLSVDLKTDLMPSREFHVVRTELSRTTFTSDATHPVDPHFDRTVDSYDDFVRGERVADFEALDAGSFVVRVSLLNRSGDVLADRHSRVELHKSYVLSVAITRSCSGVTCPPPGGDPSLDTCFAGECTDARCTPETIEFCGEPECALDSECTPIALCAIGRCIERTCFFVPQHDRCAAGQACDVMLGCTAAECADGGVTSGGSEGICSDGADQDCDGRIDCEDSDCDAKNCGASGEMCMGGDCVCPTGSVERVCDDAMDEDCDGRVDCADADCDGATCGTRGRICTGGACGCATGDTETACADGADNDCDGQVDCDDPNCGGHVCGGGSNMRCCSSRCVNIDTDEANCGGCGLSCYAGYDCVLYGGNPTCDCNYYNSQCHGGRPGWLCSGEEYFGVCACLEDSGCAPGQRCETGGTGPNHCVYID